MGKVSFSRELLEEEDIVRRLGVTHDLLLHELLGASQILSVQEKTKSNRMTGPADPFVIQRKVARGVRWSVGERKASLEELLKQGSLEVQELHATNQDETITTEERHIQLVPQLKIGKKVTALQRQIFEDFCCEHDLVFAVTENEFGRCTIMEASLETGGSEPFQTHSIRY